MSNWTLVYSRQAQKDAKEIAASGLKQRAQRLLEVVAEDPFGTPPRYEKLVGDLADFYSRRINIQHWLVYEIVPERHVVHVLRMWTHLRVAVAHGPLPPVSRNDPSSARSATPKVVAALSGGGIRASCLDLSVV